MNGHGTTTDTDPRTVARRRRAKRALVAGYIHEIRGRDTGTAGRRREAVGAGRAIEQPRGG